MGRREAAGAGLAARWGCKVPPRGNRQTEGGGWGQKANACPAGEPRSPRSLSFLRPRTVRAPTRLTRHRASAGNRRSWRVRESAAGQVGECGGSSAARTRPRPPPSLSHAWAAASHGARGDRVCVSATEEPGSARASRRRRARSAAQRFGGLRAAGRSPQYVSRTSVAAHSYGIFFLVIRTFEIRYLSPFRTCSAESSWCAPEVGEGARGDQRPVATGVRPGP